MPTPNETATPTSSRPSNPIGTFGYLGFAFIALFLITFLGFLLFWRGALRETRNVLNQDLEGTVRQINRSRVPAPMVGEYPRRGSPQLEVDQEQ